MFDLLLRRARLVDDTLTDIAIQDGKIAALGEISAPPAKPSICRATATSAPAGLTPTFTATRIRQFITMSRTASVSPPASPP